jgi:hypothetical protein
VRRVFLLRVLQVTALAVPAHLVFLPQALQAMAHAVSLLPGLRATVLRVVLVLM